jgi:cation diffusion facilitator family transporter
MDRNSLIKKASIISIAGNATLAISKILIGYLSGSAAVVADGLDSFTDVFVSLITLVISIVMVQSPDKEHPYGHFRAETIATAVLAFIIFFVGSQLTVSAVGRLINHDYGTMPGVWSVYVTLFSIAGKSLLAWSQYKLGKKSESSMILANSRNMFIDLITSVGVLAGLAFIYFLGLPVIDRIIAAVIGVWIMFNAISIFKGTITEVMEGETDMSLYEKVFEEVKKVSGLMNPHRLRIRKISAYYLIELDVEADGELSINDAHDKVKILENNIRESIPYVYDIFIHIEPLGNIEEHERWGLKEKDLI